MLALAISYGNVLMYSVSFERCLHLAKYDFLFTYSNIETENYEKPSVTSAETP